MYIHTVSYGCATKLNTCVVLAQVLPSVSSAPSWPSICLQGTLQLHPTAPAMLKELSHFLV